MKKLSSIVKEIRDGKHIIIESFAIKLLLREIERISVDFEVEVEKQVKEDKQKIFDYLSDTYEKKIKYLEKKVENLEWEIESILGLEDSPEHYKNS